jgi:hypothetical protein
VTLAQRHLGTKQAIVLRLVHNLLPLLEIKTHVDKGLCLKDGEIEVMFRMVEQTRRFRAMAGNFPDLGPLLAKIIQLNEQITRKALHNESTQ